MTESMVVMIVGGILGFVFSNLISLSESKKEMSWTILKELMGLIEELNIYGHKYIESLSKINLEIETILKNDTGNINTNELNEIMAIYLRKRNKYLVYLKIYQKRLAYIKKWNWYNRKEIQRLSVFVDYLTEGFDMLDNDYNLMLQVHNQLMESIYETAKLPTQENLKKMATVIERVKGKDYIFTDFGELGLVEYVSEQLKRIV